MSSSIVTNPGTGQYSSGPSAPEQWKRAILRAPPTEFLIDPLAPIKKSGSYYYAFRITAIIARKRSSLSSAGSHSEYEIWRKWEDCLWFQDALEVEYRRAARSKRQRLLQGKGVKKNGMYVLKDAASSWESLPPGPDPNSVARDIHEYLPKLTKKGTVFRASQVTIDQRQAELAALIEALMRPDQPALVQELLCNRDICDFFGFWQRDNDFLEKAKASVSKPRASVTGNVLSMYFSSSSTASLHEPEASTIRGSSPVKSRAPGFFSNTLSHSSRSVRSPAPSNHSVSPTQRSTTPSSRSPASYSSHTLPARPSTASGHNCPQNSNSLLTIPQPTSRARSDSSPLTPTFVGRPRAVSTTSTDSSSTPSTGSCGSPTASSVTVVLDEVPILFGHNPNFPREDRPTSITETISEDMLSPPKGDILLQRKGSIGDHPNRSCRVYGASPTESPTNQLPGRESVRESWQTTGSKAAILEDLDLDLLSDEVIHREARGSIASFMTECSADAILGPRPPPIASDRFPRDVTDRRPLSVIEDEDNWDGESKLDVSIFDAFPMPVDFIPTQPESRPETPVPQARTGNVPDATSPVQPLKLSSCSPSKEKKEVPKPKLVIPTQPPASQSASPATFSTSAIGIAPPRCDIPDIVTVKVSHNSSIILLRTSRDITFDEMKKRIYNKFVGQEGVPLTKGFKIAFVHHNPSEEGLANSAEQHGNHEEVINGQDDWELVTYATDSNKLSLRVLDPVPTAAPST